MARDYTRREFGAYTFGLGLAGSAGSSLSGRVRAAETGYDADAAGVPRPTTETELRRALNNASEHEVIDCPEGTVYEPGSTLAVPESITLDLRGATVRPRHSGVVIDLGGGGWSGPGDGPNTVYGGTIEMGSSSGIGVRNRTDGRRFWPAVPVGTHVSADPGSGATGYQILLGSGGNNNAWDRPVFSTAGVDTPLHMRSRSGFITSVNAHLTAADFVNGVVCDGDGDTISHTYTVCRFTPGPNTESGLVNDIEGRRNCIEGWLGDASKYDQLVRVREARKNRTGQHTCLSWDGYSSATSPGLVRDTTDANDTRVVDFAPQ